MLATAATQHGMGVGRPLIGLFEISRVTWGSPHFQCDMGLTTAIGVCSLGKFDARPGYRSKLVIFPIGYSCTSFPEALGEGNSMLSLIKEAGEKPNFCVCLKTHEGKTHVSLSPLMDTSIKLKGCRHSTCFCVSGVGGKSQACIPLRS
jgi:hypothetical protein